MTQNKHTAIETKPGRFESIAGDILVDTQRTEWADGGGGSKFQILRTCKKTGEWVLFVNMQPGAGFQAHRHEGNGQFFVTKGELIYDAGRAPAGTYGFEPLFAEHFHARCEVETEYLFIGQGTVIYYAEDGSIDYAVNARDFMQLGAGEIALDVGAGELGNQK
jgi:anti-sigma factor ChrR (cupin superfamily)